MGGRFARGWSLARKSWNVVEHDRSLLLLPALSFGATAIATALIVVPAAVIADESGSRTAFFVAAAILAYPFNFISTYFGVAFVAVARMRLAGEPATVRDGFALANSRLGSIAKWALLATIVGLAIQALQRFRGGALAARLAALVIGAAWGLATFFVVPVLATRDIGAVGAARQSAGVFRAKWGEGVVGSTVIGVVFAMLLIPCVIVGFIGWESFASSPAFGTIALALAVGLGFVVLAAQSAVEGLFRLVLFDYATDGVVRAPFSVDELDSALSPKRRLFGR